MDEQARTEPYTPPMLIEIGEFSEDTLGAGGGDRIDSFYIFP